MTVAAWHSGLFGWKEGSAPACLEDFADLQRLWGAACGRAAARAEPWLGWMWTQGREAERPRAAVSLASIVG